MQLRQFLALRPRNEHRVALLSHDEHRRLEVGRIVTQIPHRTRAGERPIIAIHKKEIAVVLRHLLLELAPPVPVFAVADSELLVRHSNDSLSLAWPLSGGRRRGPALLIASFQNISMREPL